MYIIKADVRKNRLYIKLAGFLSDDEIKKTEDEIKREIARLQPNLTIISDLSEFKPASQSVTTYIKSIQSAVFQKGTKCAVRIVKNRIAGMQFKRTQREIGATYDTLEAESLEEAERLLDSLE